MKQFSEVTERIRTSGRATKRLQWKLVSDTKVERKRLGGPADMKVYAPLFDGAPSEMFVAFFIDADCRVICYDVVSSGMLNICPVDARGVFRGAILSNAYGVIIAHNHPSGNLEPSPEDINVTKKLIEAGKLLNIPVVDHVLFADNEMRSFALSNLI